MFPEGNDLARKCWVMVKPAGSACVGEALEALVTNLPMSTPDLSMVTLSGPAIVPVASRSQPCEPAALAARLNGPNGVVTASASNFSLMFSPSSPDGVPEASENVWVNCPPYTFPPWDEAVVDASAVGFSMIRNSMIAQLPSLAVALMV